MLIQSLLKRVAKLEVEKDKRKELILLQGETIQAQRDEIAMLKCQKARPRLKTSRLDQKTGGDKPEDQGKGISLHTTRNT